jgi:hypothetical protein
VGAIDRQQARADADHLALNALAAQGKSKDIQDMIKRLNRHD